MAFRRGTIVVAISLLSATLALAFDAPAFLFEVGSQPGDGELILPQQLDVDTSGNLFVGDRFRVVMYDDSGLFVRTWGWGVQDGSPTLQVCSSGCQPGISGSGAGQFGFVSALAVDAAGDVYVADFGRIQKFTSAGALLLTWGQFGSGDGELSSITEMEFGPNGNLYVADAWFSRVQAFDSNGTFLFNWGQHGTAEGDFFGDTEGLSVGPNGDVYVVANGARISRFDEFGNFILMWGWGVNTGAAQLETCTSGCVLGIAGSGPGQLFDISTQSLAVDSDGVIYQSQPVVNRIQVFDDNGVLRGEWGTTGSGPGEFELLLAVATSDSGRVFATDRTTHRIQAFGTPSPSDQTEALVQTIESLVTAGTISATVAQPLTSTLQNVLKSLDRGNVGAAQNQLLAFVNKVEARRSKRTAAAAAHALESQRGKKIPASVAQMLINEALSIWDALNEQ